jgi:hypothetical protein
MITDQYHIYEIVTPDSKNTSSIAWLGFYVYKRAEPTYLVLFNW